VFTGIVLERGGVVTRAGDDSGLRLEIEGRQTAARTKPSDSVSIDGCDLTALRVDDSRMAFEAVPETLRRTTLGRLGENDEVNLEPALRVGDPLGGHYVQGHVDGVGTVRAVGDPVWIDLPPELMRYVVEKGSITVDGVSLTVAAVDERGFAVALVPHTLEITTLGALEGGARVNIEVDVLAKYVERLLPSER
jgi:riboflavin synthase